MADQLPTGWSAGDGKLVRRWETGDFQTALKLTNQIGAIAEKLNHHPDLQLGHGYLTASTITHSAGKLTDHDYQLAIAINEELDD